MMEKTTAEKIREFSERKNRIVAMGGEKMVRKQQEQGKLTARERLDLLFDQGTFQEIQLFVKHRSTLFGLAEKEINADGVITGFGRDQRPGCLRRRPGFHQCRRQPWGDARPKICKAMDMAIEARKPFIALNDSGGARIQEGITALQGYAGIFYRNSIASGYIPQISAIMGPTAGAPSTRRRSRTGSSW